MLVQIIQQGILINETMQICVLYCYPRLRLGGNQAVSIFRCVQQKNQYNIMIDTSSCKKMCAREVAYLAI